MCCKKNSKPKEMFFGTKLISVQHLRSDDHTTERDGSKTVWLHARSINMIICTCSLHDWAGNMARSLGHMQANAESAENDKATSTRTTPISILGFNERQRRSVRGALDDARDVSVLAERNCAVTSFRKIRA